MLAIFLSLKAYEGNDSRLEKEFTILYNKYKNPIFSYIYYLCNDRFLAEEICQEVFLKVYLNIEGFEGKSSFKTWIYRIAKNTYFDFAKKASNSMENGFRILDENIRDKGLRPDEHVVNREKGELIKKALGMMSYKYRTYIILRDVQGFSYKEIRDITGEKLNTVKVGIYRARREFTKIYKKMEG